MIKPPFSLPGVSSLFRRNGMLKEGRVVSGAPLTGSDRREITSIVRYLYAMEGGKPFREHFTFEDDPGRPWNLNAYTFTDTLMKSLGLTPLYGHQAGEMPPPTRPGKRCRCVQVIYLGSKTDRTVKN